MDYVEPWGIIGKDDPFFKLHSLAEILIIQLCENSDQENYLIHALFIAEVTTISWNHLETKIYSQPLHRNDSNKNLVVEKQDMRIMFTLP